MGDLAARRVLFAREVAAVGVFEPDAGVYAATVEGIAGVWGDARPRGPRDLAWPERAGVRSCLVRGARRG